MHNFVPRNKIKIENFFVLHLLSTLLFIIADAYDPQAPPPIEKSTVFYVSEVAELDEICFKIPTSLNWASENFTYTYHKKSRHNYFDVSRDGVITLKRYLDYEVKKRHVFGVNVQSKKITKYRLTVTAVVWDVNDNVPYFYEKHYKFQTLTKGKINSVVGKVDARDRDENPIISYEFATPKDMDDAGPFFLNSTGHIIRRGEDISPRKYNFKVKVTDGKFNSKTDVTINVERPNLPQYSEQDGHNMQPHPLQVDPNIHFHVEQLFIEGNSIVIKAVLAVVILFIAVLLCTIAALYMRQRSRSRQMRIPTAIQLRTNSQHIMQQHQIYGHLGSLNNNY